MVAETRKPPEKEAELLVAIKNAFDRYTGFVEGRNPFLQNWFKEIGSRTTLWQKLIGLSRLSAKYFGRETLHSAEQVDLLPVLALVSAQYYLAFSEAKSLEMLEKVEGGSLCSLPVNMDSQYIDDIERIFLGIDPEQEEFLQLLGAVFDNEQFLIFLAKKIASNEASSYTDVDRYRVLALLIVQYIEKNIENILANESKSRPIRILDLGCSLGIGLPYAFNDWLKTPEAKKYLDSMHLDLGILESFKVELLGVDLVPEARVFPWALASVWPGNRDAYDHRKKICDLIRRQLLNKRVTGDMTNLEFLTDQLGLLPGRLEVDVVTMSFASLWLAGPHNPGKNPAIYPSWVAEELSRLRELDTRQGVEFSPYALFLHRLLTALPKHAVTFEVGRDIVEGNLRGNHPVICWPASDLYDDRYPFYDTGAHIKPDQSSFEIELP